MSLEVNIEKKLDGFTLRAAFTAGNTSTALLGASGCGKSMTLRCIAGIVKPDRGRIVLDGRVLFDSAQHIDLPPQQRGVGLLFQNYALFPNMTVEQNILCGLKTEKDPAARRAACAEMLRAMRLETLAKRYPAQLSGGQQQRAALARILVGKPRILMLDEPFSALDSYLREEVEGEVGSLLANFAGTDLAPQPGRGLPPVQRDDRAERGAGAVCRYHQGRFCRPAEHRCRAADRLQEHFALHPAGQPHRPAGRLGHHLAADAARPGGLHRRGHPRPRLYALRCGCAQRHPGKSRFHQ